MSKLKEKAASLAKEIAQYVPSVMMGQVEGDEVLAALLGAEAYFATRRRDAFGIEREELIECVICEWCYGRTGHFIGNMFDISAADVHAIITLHGWCAPYVEEKHYSMYEVMKLLVDETKVDTEIVEAVSKAIDEYGVMHGMHITRPREVSRREYKAVVELWCNGYSYEVIAREAGRKVDEIVYILKGAGYLVVDRTNIVKAYRQGRSVDFIATMYNVPCQLVAEELNSHGYTVPRAAVDDFNSGTIEEIAAHLEESDDSYVYTGDSWKKLGNELAVECSQQNRCVRKVDRAEMPAMSRRECDMISLMLRVGVDADLIAWKSGRNIKEIEDLEKEIFNDNSF